LACLRGFLPHDSLRSVSIFNHAIEYDVTARTISA